MSLTSYRAAPPRDQRSDSIHTPRGFGQVFSKRIYAVPDPVAGQLEKFEPHFPVNVVFLPIRTGKTEVGWARKEVDGRHKVLKRFFGPARVIPGSDQDGRADFSGHQ